MPWIETATDRVVAIRRQRITLASSAGTLVLMIIAVHLFYRPLDVLWQIILRRVAS